MPSLVFETFRAESRLPFEANNCFFNLKFAV